MVLGCSMAIKSISIANYRSFPVEARDFPCSGEFSCNVNVIVGPNGAGKTNFLNAIRICFDRSTFTSQGQFLESKADFHDPERPLSIIVHLVNVPQFGNIDMSYHHPSLGCPSYRLLNENEVDLNSDQWKNLKAHVFPSSFPRKSMTSLHALRRCHQNLFSIGRPSDALGQILRKTQVAFLAMTT